LHGSMLGQSRKTARAMGRTGRSRTDSLPSLTASSLEEPLGHKDDVVGLQRDVFILVRSPQHLINIYAHPLWLYHPSEAEALFGVEVSIANGWVVIEHDWAPTPLRRAFLESKIETVWTPLVAALRDRGLLPDDWERIVRCALFCCPTLVTNLRAGESQGPIPGRSSALSALSFAIAAMAGSEPEGGGTDPFTRFFAAISPRSR